MARLARKFSIHEFPDYQQVTLRDEYPAWFLDSVKRLTGRCIYCGKLLPRKDAVMDYCSQNCREFGKWSVHDEKIGSMVKAIHLHFGFECNLCHSHMSYFTKIGVELPIYVGEVDHIIPLNHGGEDKISNLQLLCDECHDKKTKSEDHTW